MEYEVFNCGLRLLFESAFFSLLKSSGGRVMLAGILQKDPRIPGYCVHGSCRKAGGDRASDVKNPDKLPTVGLFRGPCRRFVRPSICLVAVLLVSFSYVPPGVSA